ncbi:MAG: amidohydrolase family protein, partial [Cellvibrionaceae bacterium]|nr:amidohydrolase family protein [Cellvibrionaceae bacterium]
FLPMLPAMGFTTVFDAGMIMATEMGHEALRKLEQKQQLNTRLVTSYSLFVPEQVEGIVEALKTHQKKYRSARISPNTLKIHNDGTTEAESAAQFQPYLNNPDNRGAMILQGEALAELTEKVAAAGFNIHAHALGERAVKETLDAFAKARAKGHKNRFTMAHVELIRPADQGRFGELDITIQTTPVWAAYGRGHARAVLGGERASRIYSYGEALSKGARLTFGSDFPVSNGLQGLNPMVQIESGITRALPGAAVGSGQPLTGSQLSLARMIQGYTIDAAYQLGLEQQVGSIEVGKSADMAVMEQNIFALAPQHIHAAPVYMTLLQGQPVYHAEQAPAEVKSLIKATAAGQH